MPTTFATPINDAVTSGNVKEIALSQIKMTTFVRAKFDDDRIMHFAYIFEAGGVVNPIIVNQQLEIIDGRHRYRGADAAGKTTIRCIVVPTKPRGLELLDGLVANMGGALPPKRSDLVVAVAAMLKEGLTQSAITKSLPLPLSYTKKVCEAAFAMIHRVKVIGAVEAVASGGMTANEAAERFGMEPEDLKTEIRGRRKNEKAVKAFTLPKVKSEMSNRYASVAQKTAHMMSKLMDGFVDGECSETVLLYAVTQLESKAADMQKVAKNWRERVATMKQVPIK